MKARFWDSEEAEGKYLEVIVNTKDGEEYIYWVPINKKPDDEDEYDWAIEAAVNFHDKRGLPEAEEAEAMEPFSRDESEFTFVS